MKKLITAIVIATTMATSANALTIPEEYSHSKYHSYEQHKEGVHYVMGFCDIHLEDASERVHHQDDYRDKGIKAYREYRSYKKLLLKTHNLNNADLYEFYEKGEVDSANSILNGEAYDNISHSDEGYLYGFVLRLDAEECSLELRLLKIGLDLFKENNYPENLEDF